MYYYHKWISPIGELLAICDEIQLIQLSLANISVQFCSDRSSYIHPILKKVQQQICEYFLGKRALFDIPIYPSGTDFEKRVWQQLRSISYGQTYCYEEIAQQIGHSKAARAIGAACKKNPILFMIPCHRVIGKNKKMVGFSAGGINIKQDLINHERGNLLN
ncbi:MAG: methylated-DNA--[protein]-cysteine S-methyltransferase [Spirochaetia bacterium]